MKRSLLLVGTGIAALQLAGCASLMKPPQLAAYGTIGSPQLFEGMGPHARKISTSSPQAEAYFNQGLNWIYAFNHDEAVRSFTKAAEIDPDCAMAWWGVSYTQGPNYNDPFVNEARSKAAWEALQAALARIDNTTPVERALIEALAHRYADPPPEDRKELNKAFADAMADVWARFPNDSDIGTLYADAMMVQHPWKLYTPERKPARDETLTIVSVLEKVLELDSTNPGANHLYIHAVEPSERSDRGVPAADRLSGLVPGSGHLEHMPSHIYVQTGQWDRSIEQNARAMKSDDKYRVLSPEQSRQHGYMTHNAHMLAFSAMMVGREREAMAAARDMWADLNRSDLRRVGPFLDSWMCSIYDVQKRFGRWDELLAEPAPPKFMPITTAVWRAHRAIAYAAKKDFKNAAREQMAFRRAMKAVPPIPVRRAYSMAVKFLLVSEIFIEGEIALQKGEWEEAAELLKEAAVIEDTLGYGEPPMWLQPVRHTLGAVYLKMGRYADAERAYREDLSKWRDNGWSLYGLSRALELQGKTAEANTARRAFDRIWAKADEPIVTSCKCIPRV